MRTLSACVKACVGQARRRTTRWSRTFLQSLGFEGAGKFESHDASALIDTLNYKASFAFNNFTQFPGAGAFYISPLFFSGSPVSGFADAGMEDDEPPNEFACSNGATLEEYVFILPVKMKILAMPDNMTLKTANLIYKATCQLKGNQLTVSRHVTDTTRSNVCGPPFAAEYREFANKLLTNLKAQVVYK